MGLFKWLSKTESPQELYVDALKLIKQEKYSTAIRLLEKVLQLDPISPPCHFTIGYCYAQMIEQGVSEAVALEYFKKNAEHFKTAVDLAEKYGGLNDDNTGTACWTVGNYFLSVKQYQAAIKYLEQAVILCPDMVPARLQLSTSYYMVGNGKRAHEIARECLEMFPTDERAIQHWKALCQEGTNPST